MATDRLVQRTLATLRDLRDRATAFEAEHARELEFIEPHCRASARDLLHYLSIRQLDIRDLQQDLHSLGLSSLGVLERMEEHHDKRMALLRRLSVSEI